MKNAETVLDAIKTRRSIRKFKEKMPPADVVQRIMEAGTYAASSMGKQSAVIVDVRDKAVRDRLSAVNCRIGGWKQGFDPFYGAPELLIVLADETGQNRVYDGSLVMGNLMLAAHALGLASCWIHRAKETFALPEWKEYLKQRGLSGAYEGIGICALGYADGAYPAPPPRKANRIFPEEKTA